MAGEYETAEPAAWLCRDVLMGDAISAMTDGEHAKRRASQEEDVWLVEPLYDADALVQAREEGIKAAAEHLTLLSNALYEKCEHIAAKSDPWGIPNAAERDAAVMAYDFAKAADAIRSLDQAGGAG